MNNCHKQTYLKTKNTYILFCRMRAAAIPSETRSSDTHTHTASSRQQTSDHACLINNAAMPGKDRHNQLGSRGHVAISVDRAKTDQPKEGGTREQRQKQQCPRPGPNARTRNRRAGANIYLHISFFFVIFTLEVRRGYQIPGFTFLGSHGRQHFCEFPMLGNTLKYVGRDNTAP